MLSFAKISFCIGMRDLRLNVGATVTLFEVNIDVF